MADDLIGALTTDGVHGTGVNQPAPIRLGPASRAIADVFDRRRLLLLTQGWMLIAAAGLAMLTAAGITGPVLLLVFTFAIGVGTAFNAPAWQAIVPEIVHRETLPAAVALNSAGINLARAIGPALGGLIVAKLGPQRPLG